MSAEADRDARVVVCAVDGSSADAGAVEVATQLAVLAGARLALVAIAPVPVGARREFALPAWTLEEAMRALELTSAALESRVGVDCYLDAGNPARRLVEFSARTRALLLVVGTHARASGRPPSILASGLIRAAPCPVVVVPEVATLPKLHNPTHRA
jgi:nucleotide-binding universal stress UspA family protein